MDNEQDLISADGAKQNEEVFENGLVHFDPPKAKMLQAMEKNYGIVTYAAKEAGISRAAHYKWMAQDSDYRRAVEYATEAMLDLAEQRLFDYIDKADLKAIKYFLSTRGRNRGYSPHKSDKVSYVKPQINIVTRNEEQAAMIEKLLNPKGSE